MKNDPNRFYVYAVLVNGVVRYIGKGSGRREEAHVRHVMKLQKRKSTVRLTRFYAKLRAAINRGCAISYTRLVNGLTNEEAFEREIKEIAKRPKSQLWNVLPGGEGALRWTNNYRKRASQTTLLNWRNPSYRVARLKEIRKRYSDQAWLEWRRQSHVAAWTKEKRIKFAKKVSKQWTAERKVAHAEGRRRAWADPEFRERVGRAISRAKQNKSRNSLSIHSA